VLSRNKFAAAVEESLSASFTDKGGEKRIFCAVLGDWLLKDDTKCAHVAPKSFETRILAYLFGANDAALANPRNGIILHQHIESGFDNGWLVIVPDGKPNHEDEPTEWKIVVLNQERMDRTIRGMGPSIVRYKDIHNRRLTWRNENRPARRYLYFRYAMALMYAEHQAWPDYRLIEPPGKIWASPNKPNGYLRESVLRNLARAVNDCDTLSEELIEAGTFVDTCP
jgi:hypothetical protein